MLAPRTLRNEVAHAVRRAAARRELAAMPGVRGAGWVDRMTVLLLVSSRGAAHSTLSDACRHLAAHGDVSGLAVRVQEVAADTAAAATLQGECRPAGPAAMRALQAPAAGDGAPDPAAEAERIRRQQESLRILSESTPELPAPPDPG